MGRDKDRPTQYTNPKPMPSNTEKSIEYLRFRQYDYKANANLVLTPENRPKLNEPTGEPEPLKVGELKRFGDLAQREKAPIVQKKKKPVQIKKKKIELEHKDILASTEDFFDQKYQPKTEETSAAYEELLAFIQPFLGDHGPDVLRSATDEVLAILKDEKLQDPQRLKEIRTIIKKLSDDDFRTLVNIGKKITDYYGVVSKEGEVDESGQEISVVFEEEEDDEELDYVKSDSEEEEEGEETMTETLKTEKQDVMEDVTEDEKDLVNPRDIDAYWLQRELSKFYKDATQSQQLSEQILDILENSNDSECENKLMLMLSTENFSLIKILLKNRWTIVYCTKLARAKDEQEKKKIEDEMRSKEHLRDILDELQGVKKMKAPKKEQVVKEDKMEVDTEEKKYLDLEQLVFEQGAHFMANRECKLPKGTTRTTYKGFEEVVIPKPEKPEILPDERLVPIKELPEWARQAFDKEKELNRIQSRMYKMALFSPENLLLCAPTGAGKTNVALLCILHEIGLHLSKDGKQLEDKDFKIIYVAPMKALVQELVGSFAGRLNKFGITVQELTGDRQMTKQQIDETQLIITTPEKWDIVTRKSGDRTYVNQVKLLIIDEIHLLHDDRGPVLESIVSRTIRQQETTQEQIRIIGLSATLPNYRDVASFLRVKPQNVFFFDSSYRPVPMKQCYIGITERKALKRLELMNRITFDKVMEKVGSKQVLVFVHSRKETAKTARALRDMATEADLITKFISDQSVREILRTESEGVKNAELKELLPYGIGIHHAGLCRLDRGLVEDLFYGGHIQVLVSTATLAWGVNLPAHTVIIKGTQIYNPEKGRWTELSPLDIMQMMGRAGRPRFDKEGEGILITSHPELQYYLSLLNQQLPIESQFVKRLADNLNAEVVLGTVHNAAEAVHWLGYTYLFVRMLRNPQLYGITPEEYKSDPQLYKRRMDLIHTAATILDKHNLMKYDRKSGNFQVTDLGRVASHYYIPYQSIATYNEHLKPTMTDIDLFRLFSLSVEFKYMNVRREEKLELQKLIERVPIPVKESVEEASAKVNVLLQAYISQLKLEGYALIADMTYITQSAARIMRAIFEIVLKKKWAQLADRCLNLAKMIEKRMWKSQSPLRQFRGIPEDIIKKIEKKDISWDRLYDLSPAELGEMVRYPKMGTKLYKVIHQFPRLDLTAHVQPITRSLLRVELTITPDFQYVDSIHGSAEAFWIIVEDVDGETILHQEPFLLVKRYAEDEHYVTFTVPMFDPLPPQYFIKIVSDRWLGSETVLPVSFRHLILPEKYPQPTELLDLKPLPISALRNPKYEALYSMMKTFNPIQTQVFNTFYSTDYNILLAAPTGSGKTLCAELAMLRVFNQFDDTGRIVYIAPLEAIAQQQYRHWSKKFGALGKNVVVLTGEVQNDLKLMNQAHIIISQPEHWDALSRRWKVRPPVQKVKLFIVDELHLIGGDKGPVLEVIVSRMRYITTQLENHSVRIIGLCTSLANAKDLGEWIGASTKTNSLFNFHPNVRPVPLEINIRGFSHFNYTSRVLAMTKPTYNAIKNKSDGKPVIVFVPSKQQARFTALELITYIASEDDPKKYCTVKNLEALKQHIPNKALQQSLEFGVAFYHKSLTDAEKKIVETLYQAGNIKILVSTYDLAWGMDLTAHLVVIMGTQYYDGKEHRYADYTITDILQMMGRASRPLVDDSGVCYIFCHEPKKEYYKRFLYEPFPVESHFDHFLADHMNAEIVTKTITTKQDAVDYLTWTFLYRRLRQNPNYYNLHGTTHHHLSDYLSELVENTLSDLQQCKCITIDDQNIAPLNLGMVASYYYIKYTTIELFSSSLTANTKLRGLIEILSAASEFDDLPMRHGEDDLLANIAKHLPLKIDKPKYTDPHTKVNILLQSHFSRNKLSDELERDKAQVLKQCERLIQAMVDVISSNGWLSPALAAMELAQMVVQATWDRDPILMQLPFFTKELCKKCADAGIETVFDLIEMDDQERNKLLNFTDDQMSDVADVLNRYPNIDLNFEVQEAEQLQSGGSVVVNIQFDVEETENKPVHAPFFPGNKQEAWWIVIGDPKTNQLVSIKRVIVKKKSKTKVEFIAPEPGEYTYKLYFMSDSYLGVDQEYDLPLKIEKGEDDDEKMEE